MLDRTSTPSQNPVRSQWLAFAFLCMALAACSPEKGPAQADAVVAAPDVVADTLADGDVAGEVADTWDAAIADAPGLDGQEVDADLVDAKPVADAAGTKDTADADVADAAVAAEVYVFPDVAPVPFECTGTAVYPPEGTTLLLDVGPLVPNPEFTCGNAPPPQPGAVGCSTCDCPLPYSCYCNGECAWLRTPDLKKPHFNSKAVWTGKWVVSVTYDDVDLPPGGKYNHAYYMRAERWDPKGGKGFQEVPLGEQVFYYPIIEVVAAAGKVVITSDDISVLLLYDPETDSLTDWKSSGTVSFGNNASTGKLIARLEIKDKAGISPKGRLRLFDPAAGTWMDVPFPTALVPTDGFFISSVVLANANAVFAYDAVYGQGPFPDGTYAKDVGHVLKYDLATGTWSDVGTVPKKWRSGLVHSAVVDDSGAILMVHDPATSVARLANDTLIDVALPPNLYIGFAERFSGLRAPCGMLLAYPAWWSSKNVSSARTRATVIRDDLSIDVLPTWGWPDDKPYGPRCGSSVLTDTDFLAIGGLDANVAHRDGYRFPLSKVCK
ncbi:MAG: hypothetical protein HY902_11915 [Deltaproteobacteria bacterium]|nr:hypothetical protein [Deltaproteobacteria bacterium]